MTWLAPHQQSEALATQASMLSRAGDATGAQRLYLDAAVAEQAALQQLDASAPRTVGIIAISAASLWFKAREFAQAERSVLASLSLPFIPQFAKSDLRTILQAVWTEEAKAGTSVGFLPGQVLVSVKGGDVVYGGAPLDLIVDKVQAVQSLFYRHIEFLLGSPLRKRGPPSRHIQEACRPWLFQAPAGSYQFSVAVQQPSQPDFFRDALEPGEVVSRFMAVLEASVDGQEAKLAEIVPDEGYRSTFVRLTRNLAPTSGGAYSLLEVRTAGEVGGVVLGDGARAELKKLLPRTPRPASVGKAEQTTIRGILRAVHLDDDWIEVVSDAEQTRIVGVQDTMDDVIGPMVNRRVIVQTTKVGSRFELVDIELDE